MCVCVCVYQILTRTNYLSFDDKSEILNDKARVNKIIIAQESAFFYRLEFVNVNIDTDVGVRLDIL